MIILDDIAFSVFFMTFLFILTSAFIEYRKKREVKRNRFISFIVPIYNDADSLEDTIKSIFDSAEKQKFEVIVVDDKSTDNSIEVLERIRKKYPIRLINNKKNLGKAISINNSLKHSNGEIIFIVDSDVTINKKAVYDVLARMEDKRIGGVSCRHIPINKGFLAKMQGIEYGMMNLMQLSNNWFSAVGFWGGCMAIKKYVFEKVGYLSENCINEDADLALKIGESGWKAQESCYPVHTHVPGKFGEWYKQKIRWSAGTMQNLVNHFNFFIKHPIVILFFVTSVILSISFILSFRNDLVYFKNFFILFDYFEDSGYSFLSSLGMAEVGYGYQMLKIFTLFTAYALFSIPYVAVNYPLKKKPLHTLLVFPFSMTYLPIFAIVSSIGLITGIFKTIQLKKGGRGW